MSKVLVSYFSASGITKEYAIKLSNKLNCDLFEIEPAIRYTSEDLDWENAESRSSVEMKNKSYRPKIKNKVDNIDKYDTVFIGYPIWWYTAPTIINTFIEENDLTGKKVYLFATSGSSSVEQSLIDLKNTYKNIDFVGAKRITSDKDIENIIM